MTRPNLRQIRGILSEYADQISSACSLEIGATKATSVLRGPGIANVNMKAACVEGLSAGVVADAGALPFSENTFDLAVSQFLLCSVERPDLVVREIARVMRRGGSYIALEHLPSPIGIVRNLQSAAEPLAAKICGTCRFAADHRDYLHCQIFRPEKTILYPSVFYPTALVHVVRL